MAGDKLDSFLEEIINKKNLSGVNDDVRQQLTADLRASLLDQINRAIIEALPEEKLDEFNQLLDKDGISDADVQQFISQSGVDIETVTARTMLRFRDFYLQPPAKPKVT